VGQKGVSFSLASSIGYGATYSKKGCRGSYRRTCPESIEGFHRCVHFHGSQFKTFQSFNRSAPFKSSKANECNARFKAGTTSVFVPVICNGVIVNRQS
jgi:hypothetical protein